MIQFSKISTRYAKAIYEYAAENKAETTLYREFQTLAASFLSLPQMRDLLDNPTLEKPKKLAVLQAAAGENISPECLRVLQLIVGNDRVDYAYPIALMYEDIYKKAKNIVWWWTLLDQAPRFGLPWFSAFSASCVTALAGCLA